MALVDSPNCTFCQNEIETLNHLFCECQYVKRFWKDLIEEINTLCPQSSELALTNDSIIFTSTKTFDPVLKLIIILSKYYIFRCKVNQCTPKIQLFKSFLYQRYLIEKCNYVKVEVTNYDIISLWDKYKLLFQNDYIE